MSKFLITVCAFGLLLSSASAQQWTDEERAAGLKRNELTRHVPSGQRRELQLLTFLNPDCSVMDGMEIRKTKEPEHGTLELVPGEYFASYAKDSVLAKCNGKKVHAVAVVYKSAEGYKGPDAFERYAQEVHFNVNVR